MIEIRIHGRGGQGGVTLAKLIGTTRFLLGDSVQAFGIYAAERSGAPLQAFCRFDREPIVNRNLIYEPDHVIVLDPTLIGLGVDKGLKAGGWILFNTPEPPEPFLDRFPGFRIAVIDATSIARENGLGTRSLPIVNTALLGAAARLLDMDLEAAEAGLAHLSFGGGNVTAASQAYLRVRVLDPVAPPREREPEPAPPAFPGFLRGNTGELPRIRTGDWSIQQPGRQRLTPPCNHICPAGNDVQGFLHALAEERTDEALSILLETTPFPSICGRVCPAPCMEACNRIQHDEAVNVRDLERYAGDRGRASVARGPRRDECVAVVGSGPGGLSAAYQLARIGYAVTLLEAAPHLGGLLRTGIPSYRLPREVLDREIGRITELGVAARTGVNVDRRRLLEISREFDAVLVATGLQELRQLDLGSEGDLVEQGIPFLDRANRGEVRLDGEDVVVVGGGNTAFDAARSAVRLGARSVRMVYRRTRAEMTAAEDEIEQGLEEGVQLDELTLPKSVTPRADESAALAAGDAAGVVTCVRMELGEPDESGRRRPIEVPGSEFEIPCHRVILALGQSPELSVFPEGTEVREGARLLGVIEKPIFAVGDLASREGTVTAAIGSGRRAAHHIHQTFTGEGILQDVRDETADESEVVRADRMRLHLFEHAPVARGRDRPVPQRRESYEEVHLGLEDPSEAKRCLSCGVCNECDRCVTYCPEGVLVRDGHRFIFDYGHCKGCGICAAECPRNVIFMSRL